MSAASVRTWPSRASAASLAVDPQDLDVSGQEGAHTYRLPALVMSAGGTLLAAYDMRYAGVDDLPAPMCIATRRSTDRGATWSKRTLLRAPEGMIGMGEPSLVADMVTGRVYLFFALAPVPAPPEHMNTVRANADLRQMLTWTDDDGMTWAPYRDLTPSIKPAGSHGAFATGGHGIQLSSGRLLQPYSFTTADLKPQILNLYSDDHGETWLLGEPIVAPGHDLEPESRAVELTDGSVLQDIRPGAGEGRRFHARSSDGGVTFGPAEPTDNPDPSVNADIIRLAAESEESATGDVLLFTNPAHSSRRENLTLRRSVDGGNTWSTAWTIHPGGSGYSVLADLGDGSVGLLYERDTEKYVTFARLTWT